MKYILVDFFNEGNNKGRIKDNIIKDLLDLFYLLILTHTHTNTHTHIYIVIPTLLSILFLLYNISVYIYIQSSIKLFKALGYFV